MIANEYLDLIRASIPRAMPAGLTTAGQLNSAMFDHQRVVTEFALSQGRAALFLDTGLGKSLCAFEWARRVQEETGKPTLMLAPLGVNAQHTAEAAKFDIEARSIRESLEVWPGLNITNYERLEKFNPSQFGAIILDESSILKSFTGVTTRKLMAFADQLPFRLACTATPAPNDHMELGQHCQFLGVMSSSEMLSRWFIADQSEMGRYRLKRHAIDSYWSWVASWSRCVEKPSDLGFSDDGFILPPLELERHIVKVDISADASCEKSGQSRLFRIPDMSATSVHKEKRLTAEARAKRIADIVNSEPSEPWLIWIDTEYESEALMPLLSGAVEVKGSQTLDQKERGLVGFASGDVRVLVTKPSIAGYGLNYQHCARVAFMGLSFSYEAFYQAVRRCWRFGQKRPVHVHVAMAETEEAIWQTLQRKRDDHDTMKRQMKAAMKREVEKRSTKNDYNPTIRAELPSWL